MGGATDDLVAIRLRLHGGRVVAAELGEVAAAQKAVGTAATSSAAATARGTAGIRNSIKSVLSNSMKLRAIGRTMTYGLTLPIIGAGYFAIKTAAEFDTSMAQVKAATGVSAPALEDLRKLAIQMGADTVFSANEAAQAMLELAKGGMSAAEIKAGALDASLKLAAAGGIELATAGNQITRAMNTFGLPASQAISIANALAGAANASSADLSDMGLAFSQAGQAAASAGFSVQETAGILGAFADAGVIGSDAGTSLKVMLQRLVPQSADAASAMKQYGLDFFDANGQMKSATQIAGILQKGLGGLSQEQRSTAMSTIFGSDATRAATILMKQGADGLAKYIKATQDKDAAEKMAQARMTGLSGAIETLKGSIETAGLAFGEALKPAIVAIAGALTVVANAFTALPPEAQTAIAVLLLLVAVAGPAIFVLGTLAAAATALGIGLGTLLIALGVIAAVMALVVIFVILYKRVQWFHNAVDAVWGFIKRHWPLLLGPLLLPFAVGVRLIVRHFGTIKSAAAAVWNWIKGAAGTIAGPLTAPWQRFKGVVMAIIHAVGKAIQWLIEKAKQVGDAVGGLWEKVPGSGVVDTVTGGAEGAAKWLGKGLAGGGVATVSGVRLVGEEGPELAFLPGGTRVVDARATRSMRRQAGEVRGSATLSRRATSRAKVLQPLVFKVRGKTLAEAVVEIQEDEEARE